MKEFCVEMDKFMEENKMVFKDSDKTRKEEDEGKDSVKWWDTKERKLKVREILKQREEAERSRNAKRVEIVEEKEEEEEEVDKGAKDVPSCQGVYDLLNLKKCPQILLKDVKADGKSGEDDAMLHESVKNDNNKDRLSGLYNSLFNEMNCRSGIDKKGSRKSLSSQELLTLEKIDETGEETTRSASCIDIISSDIMNDSEIISDVKSEPVKIMEKSSPVNVTASSLNSTDDEISDSESVKTIINNYQDKPREIDEEANATSTNDTREQGEDNCGRKKSGNVKIIEVQSENDEVQSLETASEKDAKVSSSSSSFEKSTISSKSHKRSRDCECQDVASKKFHLIEEIDAEQNRPRSDEKVVDGISEKCRQHFIKEAKEFVKKESPLIDRCIEDLINKKGNWDLKNSQEDFLTCTALNITSDIFSINKTSENSDTKIGSNEQHQAEARKLFNVQNSEDGREVKKSGSSIDEQVGKCVLLKFFFQKISIIYHNLDKYSYFRYKIG